MDGRSLEDVIHKHNPPLTEDDVIGFLRHSDPDHDAWDDERISSEKHDRQIIFGLQIMLDTYTTHLHDL